MSGVVHHIDEDRMNNDPSNLMVAHNTCHVRHHMTGKVFTDEHLAHLSASKKGRPHSEAQRQALADAWADEERVKAASLRVAASNRTRAVCSDCGKEWGGVWRTRHVKEGKCIPVEDQPNG